MTDVTDASRTAQDPSTVLARRADYLIGLASRAPSLHNTQPWRFIVSQAAIELYADAARQLSVDPDGREMLISCGAALYGLRLAVRSLGYQAETELLPRAMARPGLTVRRPLARVRLGQAAPLTHDERKMLDAMPRRHTHRGSFEDGPLPAGLLAGLRADVRAEGATLTEVVPGPVREEMMALVAVSRRRQDRDLRARAETMRWSREAGSSHRDGVPAYAYPAEPDLEPGELPQRDFDLGRGAGSLAAAGPAPVVLVLSTPGDQSEDWLRAGQALHRLLLHSASVWVFASLNTQPLEDPPTRTAIRNGLGRPGWPQMLLGLGVSRTTHPTARRPASAVTDRSDLGPRHLGRSALGRPASALIR